jgi:hypothetical protein
MFLSTHSNALVKCKIATSIRLPVVRNGKCFGINSSVTVKENIVSDLFTCEYGDHKTIFYVSGDAIRFTNHHVEKYRDTTLITLFDYKNKVYDLLAINPQQYIGSPTFFVKSPNGSLYALFSHTSFKAYNLYRYSEYRLITVNNLTKGKEIFRYEEEKPNNNFMRIGDQSAFPALAYTYPLYNSFIIIMRIDTSNKLEENSLYIVDLVEEIVKEISIGLKGYIKKHIHSLKESYEITVDVDDVFLNSRIAFYLLVSPNVPTPAQEAIPESNCKLIKYKNEIPLYSQCETVFLLKLEGTASHRTIHQENDQKTSFYCSLVIQFLSYVENNELNVLLSCKKIQINVSTADYNMSVDDILLHEKYPINNGYNISESRLYSIDAFFDDYLFKNGDIYYYLDDSYKLAYSHNSIKIKTLKSRGVRFVTINNQSVLAIIQPKIVKESQNYVSIGSNRIVDLSAIKEIIAAHKEQDKQVLVIDVSKYIKEIPIEQSVGHAIRKIRSRGIKCKNKLYRLYISEESGNLYIFMVLRCVLLKGKKILRHTSHTRLAIAKNNVQSNLLLGKILFLSEPYSAKFIIEYVLPSEILIKTNNKENRNMHFLDFLSHLSNTLDNENKVFYLYAEEIMVKHKITVDAIKYAASIMEFKDIKYNRKSELRCKGESNITIEPKYRTRIIIRPSTKLYDNVAVHRFDIKVLTPSENKSFGYKEVVIFSEANLVASH